MRLRLLALREERFAGTSDDGADLQSSSASTLDRGAIFLN
jgi:hypothetical protein